MHECPRISSHRGQLHAWQQVQIGRMQFTTLHGHRRDKDEAFAKCRRSRHAWSEPKLTLHGVTEGEGCLLEDRNGSRPDNVNMERADAWRETSSVRTDRA